MNAALRRLLVGQVGGVPVDLPVFLTSPIYRRWRLNWGASADEVHAGMPGDDQLAGTQFRATRAIIAPPELGWPWLDPRRVPPP